MDDSTHDPGKSLVGRPPMFDEAMKKTTISIPESYAEYLEVLGDGSLSPGVRVATEVTMGIRELVPQVIQKLREINDDEARALVARLSEWL